MLVYVPGEGIYDAERITADYDFETGVHSLQLTAPGYRVSLLASRSYVAISAALDGIVRAAARGKIVEFDPDKP